MPRQPGGPLSRRPRSGWIDCEAVAGVRAYSWRIRATDPHGANEAYTYTLKLNQIPIVQSIENISIGEAGSTTWFMLKR